MKGLGIHQGNGEFCHLVPWPEELEVRRFSRGVGDLNLNPSKRPSDDMMWKRLEWGCL